MLLFVVQLYLRLCQYIKIYFPVFSDHRFCKYETSSERLSIVPLRGFFQIGERNDIYFEVRKIRSDSDDVLLCILSWSNTYRSPSYVIVVSCLFTFLSYVKLSTVKFRKNQLICFRFASFARNVWVRRRTKWKKLDDRTTHTIICFSTFIKFVRTEIMICPYNS